MIVALLAVGFIIFYFIEKVPKESQPFTDAKLSPRDSYKKYCGSCHLAPDPASLPKEIWREKVLPLMGVFMGIPGSSKVDPLMGKSAEERELFKKRNIIPEYAMLSKDEWEKITAYTISQAPDSLVLIQQGSTATSR